MILQCHITLRALFDRGHELYAGSHRRNNKICRHSKVGKTTKGMVEVEIIMMFYRYKVTKANLQVGNNSLLINSELTKIVKREVGSCHATHTSTYVGYMAGC